MDVVDVLLRHGLVQVRPGGRFDLLVSVQEYAAEHLFGPLGIDDFHWKTTPLGLAPRMPPYNTVISNVPGIREPMYWNGARMDGSYPASIVMDGIAVNITLLTYDQNVDFGIIACRRSVPNVQRLIDYMEDSLAELEDAAGLSAPAKKAAPKKKAKARPRKKAKPKARAKSSPSRKAKAG